MMFVCGVNYVQVLLCWLVRPTELRVGVIKPFNAHVALQKTVHST